MTIREFQSKLESTQASNRLLVALRGLCAAEEPKALLSEDGTTNAEWILWGEVTAPGYSAQTS
jgi:hypothetical protein